MEWLSLICALQLLCGLYPVATGQAELRNRSCSYQIPDVQVRNNDCLIYNLSGCPSDIWNSEDHPDGLRNFPIEVNLTRYLHVQNGVNQAAINFTFAINDKRVYGFAFRLLEGYESKLQICRYYDFYPIEKSLLLRTVFFNTDIYFPVTDVLNDRLVEVVALSEFRRPIGFKQMVFRIPDRDTIVSTSIWESLVVIDVTSYSDEAVDISFSSAPPNFNVTSYVVQLYDKTWNKTNACRLISADAKIIKVRFSGIAAHVEYIFKVAAHSYQCNCQSAVCDWSESAAFLSNDQLHQTENQFVPFVFFAFVIIVTIAIVIMLLQRSQQRPASLKEIIVHLVYSRDTENHVTVVESLATYLRNQCSCKVLLDEWDVKNKDPHVWVDDCIRSSDYIIMVWSQGAFMKTSNENTRCLRREPGYLGEDLFSLTMFKINAAIGCELRKPCNHRNLAKFIHISLPYVPSEMVAKVLPSLSTFCLPHDFDKMLCHFHGIQSSNSLIYRLLYCNERPTFAASNLSSSSDGVILLDAIEAASIVVDVDLLSEEFQNIQVKSSKIVCEQSGTDASLDGSLKGSRVTMNHCGVIDTNFPLNEILVYDVANDDHNSSAYTYWLPHDEIQDDDHGFGSFRPLVDIADICSSRR